MKIGIPGSLLYYYYYPFWQTLFEKLGNEVVLSDPTSGDLLNEGVKESVSEICVPMKVYVGQVLNLLEKGVDSHLYTPFCEYQKGYYFLSKVPWFAGHDQEFPVCCQGKNPDT